MLGEYIYATGGNFVAARLSGVPTRSIATFSTCLALVLFIK
jgi:ribose/xylose/arabinose/galactoside ABC-type transport system permease subunit